MLKTIMAKGYKNQDFIQRLSGLDLFTSKGMNGAGKSSRLEAALLLSLGYLPSGGNGNSLDGVMQYTTEGEIEVSGIFKNGAEHSITRRYEPGAKKKRKIFLNGEEFDFVEGSRRVNELLGYLPLMVDIKEFIEISDNKKKEFILRFSPEGGEIKKEGVLAAVKIKLLTEILQRRNQRPYVSVS